MFTIATATIPLTRPGPRVAMIAIASRKYGNAIRVSIERITTWSTHRPTKPASSPQTEPAAAASTVAAPRVTTRARPNTALPLLRNMRVASATPERPAGATATAPRLVATLLIADARVEDRVEQVHDQVHHHEGSGDQQHAPLHQRIVAGLDRAHHHGAEPGPGEHGLGEDGPAEQIAHLHPDHGEDRVERVLEHVPRDDHPLGQALGARRAHVVLPDDLEHARAGEA